MHSLHFGTCSEILDLLKGEVFVTGSKNVKKKNIINYIALGDNNNITTYSNDTHILKNV